MTRVFIHLLMLLFSLSGPAMGEFSDFERSSLAAKEAFGLKNKGQANSFVKERGTYLIESCKYLLNHKIYILFL